MKADTPFPCSRIDEIVYDYLDRTLEPRESQRFERHLGTCPSCASALWETERMLEGLTALKEEPESGVVEALVERFRQESARKTRGKVVELRSHQKKRRDGRPSPGPPDLAQAGPEAAARSGVSWPRLLAAGLAAVSLALSFWVVQLRSQLEDVASVAAVDRASDHDRLASLESQIDASRSELARSQATIRELEEQMTRLLQPQAFVPTAYVYPPTYLRYSGETPTVTVPRTAGFFQLTFVLDDVQGFPALQVSVLRGDGAQVWRSGAVPGDDSGHLTTLFRHGFLPAGAYRAELFGLVDDKRSELARYEWELAYE